MTAAAPTLRRTLGPVTLWGLGVGYVISGEYFGWNLGLPLAGTYGMLAATIAITIMYFTFVFSYAELACAIPRAGGEYVFIWGGPTTAEEELTCPSGSPAWTRGWWPSSPI